MKLNIEHMNNSLGKVALIIVPAFFTLSELCHPITMDSPLEEILSAHQNAAMWFLSHLFVLISLLFLPFLSLKLSQYIHEKWQKTYMMVYALTIFGVLCTVGLLSFDFMIMGMGQIGVTQEMADLYIYLQQSFFGYVFLTIGPILFLLGFFIMTVLMLMNNENKKAPVFLIMAGILIYALAGPLVPVKNGHIIVASGSLIMLVGFVLRLVEDTSKNKTMRAQGHIVDQPPLL